MENFKLQHKVQLFTQYFGTQTSPEHRLLDLTSEIGELSKEILKQTNYGKHEFTPSDDWSEELGDVFFALLCLANETDVNLEVALEGVLKKYEKRHKKKGHIGSNS